VELPPATLAGPVNAPIGSSIAIEWTGPGREGDYIDIVAPGFEKFSGELAYAYVTDKPSVSIRVPGEIGEYRIRYVWEGPKLETRSRSSSLHS
jgi:Ca-activated chloride channel family protein